jgi:tetratricopeptide (TPR) repeat protein
MNEDEAKGLLALAREAAPELRGPTPEPWHERLEREQVGLAQAMEWFVAREDAASALELGSSVWRFWMNKGHFEEGRRLLEVAISIGGAEPQRGGALSGLGTLAFRQGDNDTAERYWRQALEAAEAADDRRLVVDSLTDLARVALRRNDLDGVRAHAEQAREVARELGEKALERGPVHLLAAAARMEPDLDLARELYGESLAINRELGFRRVIATELHNLGFVELRSGDRERAKERFRESAELSRELQNMYMLPYSLAAFGIVAVEEGDLDRGARLLGASEALFEATGAVPDPDDAVEIEQAQQRVAGFEAAWNEGRALPLDEALDYGLGEPARRESS